MVKKMKVKACKFCAEEVYKLNLCKTHYKRFVKVKDHFKEHKIKMAVKNILLIVKADLFVNDFDFATPNLHKYEEAHRSLVISRIDDLLSKEIEFVNLLKAEINKRDMMIENIQNGEYIIVKVTPNTPQNEIDMSNKMMKALFYNGS